MASRTGSSSPSRYAQIQFVNVSKGATNSVTSTWVVPLGQTPSYLDPRCQEELHEVDVSGIALHVSLSQAPEGKAIRRMG